MLVYGVELETLNLRAKLREEPLGQGWFGEGPLPDLVIDTRIFGVDRMFARFAQRGDAITSQGDGNGLVGVSLKAPEGSADGFGGILGGFAAATDHRRRKEFLAMRGHVPDASAAHGLAHHVEALRIDWEFSA